MQPAYYENLEEVQNKYWSMLDDAVTNRASPFRIPVFICTHQDEVDGRSPLISYEWFPSQAKYFLQEYDFPVFPDDFAYYLLKDDKTLVMISAVKSLNANFKYDITSKKLELYPTTGKFDFIISSFSKDCGHYKFDDNYKCNIYKPLISSNLIN